MKILDCTLRDGGYYNNWEFKKNLVKNYLRKISQSGVNIIELGFRFKNNSKYGDYGHLTEKRIKNLNLPVNFTYAVMINCKDFLNKSKVDLKSLDKIFCNKKNSKISIIRIALNYEELSYAMTIAERLHGKNYEVHLNIMQISTLKPLELLNIVKKVNNKKFISVLYIADSLGDLTKPNLKTIHSFLKKANKPLGIHAHDNLNLALSNTLFAEKLGFKYLDSTILGMGRGAGNTRTEELLYELYTNKNKKNLNYQLVYKLGIDHFAKLKKKYQWGSNFYYFLSAKHQIHPTYIQKMLSDRKYSKKDILSNINLLKNFNAKKYDINILNDAIFNLKTDKDGEWYPKRSLIADEILILGPGPSVKKYKSKILSYIILKKPKVICINFNNFIDKKYINFYCSCNIGRLFMEIDKYINSKIPLIFPKNSILDENDSINKVKILNYGAIFSKKKFSVLENYCVLPENLSLFYALAVSIASGTKHITFAGLDGYEKNSKNFLNIQEKLKYLKKFKRNIKFLSLTPTTYRF